LAGAVLAALVAAGGCAEERAAIDRVQTFPLQKSFFVGENLQDPDDDPEFWAQATMVDVGFGASQDSLFTSTYAQPVTHVRWQITEDLLIARLAYERIEGTDGKGVGDKTDEGIIVAAFTIDKHFDIAYEYNSTTGEKVNVKVENDEDRPWYLREYMHVDFSKNLSTDNYDFDTLSQVGIWGGVEYEPLAYYVDDPTADDAPFFDTEKGYFDITVKAFAKPGVVDLSDLGWGIGDFPVCYLDYDFFSGSWPWGSCSPVELTIRHSFRKVEDKDFEPIDWDGWRFQAFGAFYVERFGYTRNFGMSDEQWHRFMTHYQLWERSHYYEQPETMEGPVQCFTPQTTPYGADPHRDENNDGTHDECGQVGGGSRCDTFSQKCTLPFAQRKPVTIPWYYAEGSHPDFFEPSALAAHEWDVALRSAVRTAQYAECMKVGGKKCGEDFPVWFGQQDDNEDAVALALEVDDCRAGIAHKDLERNEDKCTKLADTIGAQRGSSAGVISIAKMPEMIVLCHSPVQAGDPPACGKEGLVVRRGDLRYHKVIVVSQPESMSPWGIYTDSEDPLTGMKIAAAINVWSDINDYWSQRVVDQSRYIAGELTTEEITDGDYVHEWAKAAEAAAGNGAFPLMTRKQVEQRVGEFTAGKAVDFDKAMAFLKQHKELADKSFSVKQDFHGVKASASAPSVMAPKYAARRNAARGGQVEAALMNKEIQALAGLGEAPLTEEAMELVSPLRGGNPTLQHQLRQLKHRALARSGSCMLEAAEAPLDVSALTHHLQAKFGKFNPQDPKDKQQARAEAMRKYLARRVHLSVIAHEMGHSIGMRHNFVGSADAMFYRPQYWQLRTHDGEVVEQCYDLSKTGEDCVGPRYFDPVTKEEKDNLIQMFMHTSIMDYPGETTQDMLGIGVFDFAAARMYYGDVIAVHADPEYNIGTDRAYSILGKMDNFGGILGIALDWVGDGFYRTLHYSELQELFEILTECRDVDPADFTPFRYDTARDGVWDPLLDGMIVDTGGKHTKCRQQAVDYATWEMMRDTEPDEYDGWYPPKAAIDSQGRTRVPYGFGSDEWADVGNVSVYTHDNGADAYEIFNFLVTQQEVMHIFDNYRRGRQEFSVRGAVERALDRYDFKIRDGAKGLTLIKNFYEDYALEIGYDFESWWSVIAPDWFRDNIVASALAFDHFTRKALRPEPGPHFYSEWGGDPVLRSAVDPLGDPMETQVVVPNGATGMFGNVAFGGRPIENRLAEDMGEYSSYITVNAGSYYDKINAAMMLTESVDNFISDTRQDFVDARYRAVSIADLFPDGYRRFLGAVLAGDDTTTGPRIAADAKGAPLVDKDGFPLGPIGWTSWWGDEVESCFPAEGTTACGVYGEGSDKLDPLAPDKVAILDPQVGFEVQKFFIAWTLIYLPENQQQQWLDSLRLWEMGLDADPVVTNRIEFHYPAGKTYVARRFGQESIYGKTIEKGIAARILQRANELMLAAYETKPGPDNDDDGTPDWYLPVYNSETGEAVVLYDPTVMPVDAEWEYPEGDARCNADDNSRCTCSDNRACTALKRYVEVPAFLRLALGELGLVEPEEKGLYD